MDKFTVNANFEGTATGGNQLWTHAGRFTNKGRQTDGFRFVVSDRAIFDCDFRFHAPPSFSTLSAPRYAVEAERLTHGVFDH